MFLMFPIGGSASMNWIPISVKMKEQKKLDAFISLLVYYILKTSYNKHT